MYYQSFNDDEQIHYRVFEARSCEDHGETDARRGLLISECPYEDLNSIAEWQNGWNRVNARRLSSHTIHRI